MDSASGGPVWQKDVQYVLYCYIRLKLDSPLVTEHCTYGGVIWCYASTVSSTLRYRVTQLKKHVVCRDMALHILNLSSGLTYDFSFTLHPLYPQGTIPKYRKEREGPQCLHRRCPWQRRTTCRPVTVRVPGALYSQPSHNLALVLPLFLSPPVAMPDCIKVIELLSRLCS